MPHIGAKIPQKEDDIRPRKCHQQIRHSIKSGPSSGPTIGPMHNRAAKNGICWVVMVLSAMLASSHGDSYGRRPAEEVVKAHIGPPGLANSIFPPYASNTYHKGVRNELTSHTYHNQTKIVGEKHTKEQALAKSAEKAQESPKKGLKIATINVTSWSPKIVRLMSFLAATDDILLIQEHHKIRRRDMKTGPYIIAGFAPAQKTVQTKQGRGWHTSGGVAIVVRDDLYYEKDRNIPQQGLNWAAIQIKLRHQPKVGVIP